MRFMQTLRWHLDQLQQALDLDDQAVAVKLANRHARSVRQILDEAPLYPPVAIYRYGKKLPMRPGARLIPDPQETPVAS